MNIVQAGSRFQVYGEDVQTFRVLPTATYTVGFHPQMGFWLIQHSDLDTNENSIYGNHKQRVEKIFNSFDKVERNFGIILSGKKGIGKSLLARMIAEEAIRKNLPVIIVDTAIPGISDFLSSIDQEIVVIFDEFEKTFAKINDDHKDPQVEMLSLFDGIDMGKKLFVITCNDPRQLNEYLINRPGRFHYHFEITCPTSEEVREYMQDKMGNGFDEEIEKVIKLSQMADITYDCLRAIAFDLSQGYSLESTLQDLNINYEHKTMFDITVRLSNGLILTRYSITLDLYSKDKKSISFSKDKNDFVVSFYPNKIAVTNGALCIPSEDVKIECSWDTFEAEMPEADAEQARINFNKSVKVESVTFAKVNYSAVDKYAV